MFALREKGEKKFISEIEKRCEQGSGKRGLWEQSEEKTRLEAIKDIFQHCRDSQSARK